MMTSAPRSADATTALAGADCGLASFRHDHQRRLGLGSSNLGEQSVDYGEVRAVICDDRDLLIGSDRESDVRTTEAAARATLTCVQFVTVPPRVYVCSR